MRPLARGFFTDYFARSADAVDRDTANRWWRLATKTEPPAGAGPLTRGELARWLGVATPADAGRYRVLVVRKGVVVGVSPEFTVSVS